MEMTTGPLGSGIMISRPDHPSGNCKGDPGGKEEPMTVMDYRTQDGLADYGFSIEFQSDVGWRAYIIFEPFHQGHDDSLKPPYQSIGGDGRRYVDWSPKLDNLGEAKRLPGSGPRWPNATNAPRNKTLSMSSRSSAAANK